MPFDYIYSFSNNFQFRCYIRFWKQISFSKAFFNSLLFYQELFLFTNLSSETKLPNIKNDIIYSILLLNWITFHSSWSQLKNNCCSNPKKLADDNKNILRMKPKDFFDGSSFSTWLWQLERCMESTATSRSRWLRYQYQRFVSCISNLLLTIL